MRNDTIVRKILKPKINNLIDITKSIINKFNLSKILTYVMYV